MAFSTSSPVAPGGRSSRLSGRRSAAAGPSVSNTSPTCLSRIHEKDELRSLNDRLANYIQRVQELENERSSMLFQLEEKEESKSREMGTVRRLYEEELADVRKSLDGLAGEKARLQIDYGNLCEEFKTLKSRNQKKETDLVNVLSQLRRAEAAMTSKDAEYINLLSVNTRLNEDFTDLQGQLENVAQTLDDTKTQLSSEILRRVATENETQTLREQLDLQKNISEQEILEMRSRHESKLVELESGRQREFESKLAQSMQHLRQDHESQLQQYKEEIEKTYSLKLQSAQQAVLEKNEAMSATKEELETTTSRLQTLCSQLEQSQREKTRLEGHCQDLERTFDREREAWQQKLVKKEQELLSLRSQIYTQLEDYENLLDVKLALDMEINAYRKMLEVEEQRLQLSPSPSQHQAVPRTHEHGSRRIRGKKRKLEEASGSSPACKMSTHCREQGAVSVAEIDREGKYIRLKNNSEMEQPLGGWVVRRTYQDFRDISFHIPSSCILSSGETLTIWAEGAGAEAESRDLVLQGYRSWGPITDVRVVLLNPDHEEVSEGRVPLKAGGEEETHLEFEEKFVSDSDIQHYRRKPKKKKCCSVS